MNNNSNAEEGQFTKDKEELAAKLEKQIAVAQWVQAAGVFAEAILLTKLYLLKEDSNAEGEQKILAGIWVQTIGQLAEAAAVSKQIEAEDEFVLYNAQKMAIAGDWGQALGSALQAIGGEEILLADGIGNVFDTLIP